MALYGTGCLSPGAPTLTDDRLRTGSIFRTRAGPSGNPPSGRPSSSCPSSIMTKLPDLEAAPGLVAVLQLVALEGGAAVSPARKGVTRNDMRSGSEHPARDSEEVQSSNDSKMQLEDIHQERAANLQKALRRRNKFACWAVALCAML